MTASLSRVAVYALTAPAADKAGRVAAALPQSTLFIPHRLAKNVSGATGFDKLGLALAANFSNYDGHVIFAATGVVVRSLAGLIEDKTSDPAVVVVDQEGRFAVSLLSGHLGGANALAVEVARALGGQAVITTATDVAHLPSLEVVAAGLGLDIENMKALPRISRELVEGAPIEVHDPDGWLQPALEPWAESFSFPDALPEHTDSGRPLVAVSYRDLEYPDHWLIPRPRCLAVGVGCNRGTGPDEIAEFIGRVVEEHSLSPTCLSLLATAEIKRDEAGITEAANKLGVDVVYFSAEALNQVEVPNPSKNVRGHVGAKSVCEAAAILAAKGGRLLVTKQKTPNVTVAVALMVPPENST